MRDGRSHWPDYSIRHFTVDVAHLNGSASLDAAQTRGALSGFLGGGVFRPTIGRLYAEESHQDQ